MKVTKVEKIIKHLEKYRSITSWEAITLYKATRLSAVIFDLRSRGFHIQTVKHSKDGTNWAEYLYFGEFNDTNK